jgi:hypothetical protein
MEGHEVVIQRTRTTARHRRLQQPLLLDEGRDARSRQTSYRDSHPPLQTELEANLNAPLTATRVAWLVPQGGERGAVEDSPADHRPQDNISDQDKAGSARSRQHRCHFHWLSVLTSCAWPSLSHTAGPINLSCSSVRST